MKSIAFYIGLTISITAATAAAEVPSVSIDDTHRAAVEESISGILGNMKSPQARLALQNPKIRSALIQYMSYLKLQPDSVDFKSTLGRLLDSSTQMLICEDVNNWECLEKVPELTPAKIWRQDTKPNLGEPVIVNSPLQMESFFTRRWAQKKRGESESGKTVAQELGEKITSDGRSSVYLALYGIDDITGSMKPIFKALQDKVREGIRVLGVFDAGDFLRDYDVDVNGNVATTNELNGLNYSYVPPADQSNWAWGHPTWMDQAPTLKSIPGLSLNGEAKHVKDLKLMMDPAKSSSAIRVTFQYKATLDLFKELNGFSGPQGYEGGIQQNSDARARMEWPTQKIMHNKFVVLDDGQTKSVWSGTANVSRTCMGDESNSNMSIYIKNSEVADTFLEEFKEMFEPAPGTTGPKKAPTLMTGRFHMEKRPNTKRYFRFSDGHELRVHFSPTDDGEHRAIIPMLLSAKKGDIIRISMFGAGGHELVRALQYAAAQGARVKILLDSATGSGNQGWMKNAVANVFEENPYSTDAPPIEVKISAWVKAALNHHKTATLTRLESGSYRAEVLIVGSQNWSASGNDGNDENMVTIRHLQKQKNVAGGAEFNREFDENLWPLAMTMTKDLLRTSSKAAKASSDADGEDGDVEAESEDAQ